MNGKGSTRRKGKPGAYEAGWKRIFARKPKCCGKSGCTNPVAEEHTCPYAREINHDNRLCACCADCAHECSQDI